MCVLNIIKKKGDNSQSKAVMYTNSTDLPGGKIMKDFCFRFLVADEGIKVDFVQASPTEMIFKVYRDDTTTVAPNANVSETTTQIEEAVSETAEKLTRHRIDKELFDKLWNDGLAAESIADQLGTTKNSIYNYAYRNGYGRRKAFKRISAKRLIPDKLAGKIKRFVEMWNECLPITDIATEFNVSKATVCRWATEIPECISPEEKKQKRVAMKQVSTNGTSTSATDATLPTKSRSSNEDYPKTGEHLRDKEIDALCAMWRNGQQNVAYLARYFGVSKSTIYRQLRINGCRR